MSDWLRTIGLEAGVAVLAGSTVLLVVCLVTCRTVSRDRPAARSTVCTATTWMLLVLPVLALAVGAFDLGVAGPTATDHVRTEAVRISPPVRIAPRPVRADGAQPPAAHDPGLIDPLVVVGQLWLLVFGVMLSPLAISWWRARRLRAGSVPVEDARWLDLRQRIDRSLGVVGRYGLRASHAVPAPVVVGLRRPCVLLPAEMASEVPDATAAAVFAHEVGHVVRADGLGALLSRVAVALHWHHPLAWWLQREAAIAREEVCDNHALQVASPRELSEALLAWTAVAGGTRGAFVHSVRGWSLERRVRGLLSARRDVAPSLSRRIQLAVVSTVAALGSVAVVACTPRGAGPVQGAAPAADGRTASELDPVLTRLGWQDATDVALEFVYDHGGRGDVFRFPGGRPFPMETVWTFSDRNDVLDVLSSARTVRFEEDSWPEAKAAFVLTGKSADGRRLQVTFHTRSGHATVSRELADGKLEGGAWTYGGADEALVQLMQTRQPAVFELPLRHALVWRVSSETAPPSHELLVALAGTELAAHLKDLSAPPEARTPEGFDFASGVALVVRAPASEPLEDLAWGTPVLRHGATLDQLVFRRPAAGDAAAGTAAVMLLFVGVNDPGALGSVALVFTDDTRVERTLR